MAVDPASFVVPVSSVEQDFFWSQNKPKQESIKMTEKFYVQVSELTFRKLEAAGRLLQCTAGDEVFEAAVIALIEKINNDAVGKANNEFSEQCEDWQIQPSSFDGSNAVFGPPAGKTEQEVYSLCGARIVWSGEPAVLSCWKPSHAQLDAIRRTGRLWLAIMGPRMVPVALCSANPLESEGIDLAE